MRSRVLKKTVLAAVVVAMQTQILQMTLRFKITRRFSLKCCFLGHEDWIRRTSDRLSLECFECGRKTRGWTTGRITSRRAGDAVQGEPVNKPNDHFGPVLALRRLQQSRCHARGALQPHRFSYTRTGWLHKVMKVIAVVLLAFGIYILWVSP